MLIYHVELKSQACHKLKIIIDAKKNKIINNFRLYGFEYLQKH